jgi:mannose-6-phosphate isomerase-like protein (cupin superfamily)
LKEDVMTNLSTHPVHLGLGATASSEPEFTGMPWYGDYVARHASDGAEGRLVSLYHFTQNWENWEKHPEGEEVVICLDGEIVLVQEESDGAIKQTKLASGDYAIIARGVWHTADIAQNARVLFITAGWNTQGRERKA